MKISKAFGLITLLLCATACEKVVEVPVTQAPAPELPDPIDLEGTIPSELVGTWLLEGGSMMSDFVKGLATYSITADVTAIRIGSDGTGDVWLRDRLTGTKDCVRSFVLYDDDDATLAFDFAAETTTDVIFNIALETYTYVFPLVSVDAGSLRIANAQGQIALFSRQTTLPTDVTCADLTVLQRWDGVPAPQFFSDMALYNGDLIYSTSQNIERFSLGTHAMGTPLGSTSNRLVQTAQGAFFWTHCGCGGSRDAFKRTISFLYDTVSSENEMGGPITFRAMAYNSSTDRLWLHGRPFDTQFGQFYLVNTNSEPDVVDDTISFNRDIRAMDYDGTYIWAVVTVASQSVVQYDPVSETVLESYEVPDVDVSWSGLAVAPDGLYMLGTDLNGEGVLIRMVLPSSTTSVETIASLDN